MMDPTGLNQILFGKLETLCDDCAFGRERHCPHAEGRHYNIWGEGIGTPDWCFYFGDKNEELPF